jgi:hypothetical protein
MALDLSETRAQRFHNLGTGCVIFHARRVCVRVTQHQAVGRNQRHPQLGCLADLFGERVQRSRTGRGQTVGSVRGYNLGLTAKLRFEIP